MRKSSFILLFLCGALIDCVVADDNIDFAHEIAPILSEYCGKCHHDEEKKGGFSMNTRASILEGSENGEVIAEGETGQLKGAVSYFIEVLRTSDDEILMPPKGDAVPPEKIDLLERWIDGGMVWEPGFTFAENAWEPPLAPQPVELPPATDTSGNNPVDRLLEVYHRENESEPAAPLSESAFIRRVSLDLVGLLPNEVLRRPSISRDEKIELLLQDDISYADHWLTFWNDLLRNDYAGTGFITGGRKQISHWLYSALRENKPYDEFVRELVAPTAKSEGFIEGIQWRGTVNSSQTREIQFSQNLSQVFLGINMKCASCHDSFIDRWKLEEAYSLAAIFADNPLEIHRCDKPTGQIAKAAWIFPELGEIDPQAEKGERLRQLSELVTHRENGRFSRTLVNRLWHRLMGRGIVHPVDAMETRPWSEPLLEWLAADFVEHGYDIKHTLRRIVSSRAYQSKSVVLTGEIDNEDYTFTGPIAKRLTGEQFVDAVWSLTDTYPAGRDANVIRLPEGNDEAETPDVPDTVWIWSEANLQRDPGETFTARTNFSVSSGKRLARATVLATADNEFRAFVNNRVVAEGDRWNEVEIRDVSSHVHADKPNWIMIAATNGGSAPNPAGVFLELHLHYEDGSVQVVGTSEQWTATSEVPGDRGQIAKSAKWKKVSKVASPEVWSTADDSIRRARRIAGSGATEPMIRASLVKSNPLLRSLGRPNREQVVTVRPENLSSLQAIDLSNGVVLSETLRKGASHLAALGLDRPALITKLYVDSLAREPSETELAIGIAIISEAGSERGIEDLLWAILMLPEFQIIR